MPVAEDHDGSSEKIGIQPSALIMAPRKPLMIPDDPKTMPPHRPKTIEGTAASKSTTNATGLASFLGASWVINRAMPTESGTAMSRASRDEMTVVHSRAWIPKAGGF